MNVARFAAVNQVRRKVKLPVVNPQFRILKLLVSALSFSSRAQAISPLYGPFSSLALQVMHRTACGTASNRSRLMGWPQLWHSP